MHKNSFGQRLRELRRERGLSLEEVAMHTQTTSSTLSKYERGAIEPSLEAAKKLSNFFLVSIDWLCEGGEQEDAYAGIPQPYIEVARYAIQKKVSPEKLKKAIELFIN